MGNRANICIEYGPVGERGTDRIFFYTHWCGDELPEILRRGLAKNWRWDNHSYLARILFCELVKGSEGNEAGFGIAPYILDNEHPILVVNIDKQQVQVYNVKEIDKAPWLEVDWTDPTRVFSFTDYAALPKATWEIVTANPVAAEAG